MDELLKAYAEEFGEGFPMYQIARTRTDAETEKIIKECLDLKQDAYELGYVTDDMDILY